MQGLIPLIRRWLPRASAPQRGVGSPWPAGRCPANAPLLFTLLLALVLAGCGTPPPRGSTGPMGGPGAGEKDADEQSATQSAEPQWSARYAALSAAGGTLMRIDPQRSEVRMLVFRGGRAPGLGHNHVLTAPEFTGYFFLPVAGVANAQFDLEFRLDRLALDDPHLRSQLGAPFAAELTPGDIASTRAHMLGDDNLQAARFPFVRIHCLGITGEGSHFAADVEIEMHGRKRAMAVPLTVEDLPGRIRASGAFVLRQTDFGVQPYSALGGFIAVQDEVLVDFTLVGG